jgi:hypothetical protein
MAVKRGDKVTMPASSEIRDSNYPQFGHEAVPPEISVEKGIEHAIESHEGRSIHPPRHREVNLHEKFRRQPRQKDREERQQERNNSPFVRVCTVTVHPSPARLIGAEQVLVWACWVALHATLLLGGTREKN